MMKCLIIILLLCWSARGKALLLSNLPTPSLVLDVDAFQRHRKSTSGALNSPIPNINISDQQEIKRLIPSAIPSTLPPPDIESCERTDDCDIFTTSDAFWYLHSRVTRSREHATPGQDDPVPTFLAEIDLTPTLCTNDEDKHSAGLAKLVLGLNNHHVGSYYWARSAGAGASMDAPGVCYDSADKSRGILRWETQAGPTECNSNDGKRSEWVNFLREGDTVQLLPRNPDLAALSFVNEFGRESGESIRVFGVSAKGRPLGSEPQVVCEWKLDS